MKVQARGVNVKRHSIAWKIGGKWRTRAEAVKLAMAGKVDDVIVRRGSSDEMHITGRRPKMNLSELPVKVMPDGIVRRKAARR